MVVALGIWYAFHIMINASIRERLPSDVWIAALAIVTWALPTATSARYLSKDQKTPRSAGSIISRGGGTVSDASPPRNPD
jgi:uncharacterized membrane protein